MNAKQRFLEQVLASGQRLNIISAADVMRHVTPEVLAEHLPAELGAAVLTASLAASAMTPELVVDTVGITALAEHVPVHILWECVAEAGASGGEAVVAKQRAATAPVTAIPKTIPSKGKTAPKASKPAAKSAPATAKSAAKPVPAAAAPPVKDSSDEPAELPAPPVPGGMKKSSTSKAKAKAKPKTKPKAKPNVRAKAEAAAPPAKIPGRSEFDIDTDIGEVWESDVVVEEFEIVEEEADELGAGALDVGDWSADDETKAGGPPIGRKR